MKNPAGIQQTSHELNVIIDRNIIPWMSTQYVSFLITDAKKT